MHFNKPVKFESFWLRLHATMSGRDDKKLVKIYLGKQIVSQSYVQLKQSQWLLLMPHESTGSIVGDMPFIEKGVDLDNIELSWGGEIAQNLRNQNTHIGIIYSQLRSFKVVEEEQPIIYKAITNPDQSTRIIK